MRLNFNCAVIEFNFIEDGVESNDWRLAMRHATFSHKSECEFIFYVGTKSAIQDLKDIGFTADFLKECKSAKKAGFAYLLLFA